MFKKSKPIKDIAQLEKFRLLPCMICFKGPPSDPHHVSTKRSARVAVGDRKDNLVALCRMHHVMVHTIGQKTFFEKFPIMKKWAKENGRDDLLD